MLKPITVFKGRTNVVTVDLGFNVSADTLTSQIRSEPSRASSLLATWAITFLTDGTDGKLILTLDDSELTNVEVSKGYMDIKRLSGGEPLPLFDEIIEVVFKDAVTV